MSEMNLGVYLDSKFPFNVSKCSYSVSFNSVVSKATRRKLRTTRLRFKWLRKRLEYEALQSDLQC